jgi:hypothetical protein
MIKFFKNIRKTLINDGKTGNYLKYAIGEIILVIIGILIALQINNWNENRKNVNQIKSLLISLNKEVKLNEDYLRKRSKRKIETIRDLQSIIDALNTEISDKKADSLINALVKVGAFYDNPLQRTAIDNFNKSNLINDLKDEDLKNYILYNESYIELYEKSNKTLLDYTTSTLSPYFFKNANLTTERLKSDVMDFKPQNFKHNREAFVKNRELTNLIYEYVGWMNYQNSIFQNGEYYFKGYGKKIESFLQKK